jgi:hypothetical protein
VGGALLEPHLQSCLVQLCGRQTASREILGTVTATRGASVLCKGDESRQRPLRRRVKINNRGPYTRGRILDLSPRAADALDMKRIRVAAVVIEPVVNEMAPPTLVVFQTSGTAVSQ